MSCRKYESGFQKRKKKQRIENLTHSQKGAMDRFVIKESQESSMNQSAEPDQGHTTDNEVEDIPTDNTNIVMDINLNTSTIRDANDSFQPDIFDPRYWDSLGPEQIDILAEKGPRRDLSIQKGPKDKYSRRFSALFYKRILANGEHCDRDWLVSRNTKGMMLFK
jgi:hypothetical protein